LYSLKILLCEIKF